MNCTTNQMCTGYPGQHEVGDPCNCQITIMSCERAGSTTCEQNYSYTFDDCSTSGAGDNNPDDPNNPDTPNTGGAQTGNTNTNPGNTDAPPLDEEPDSYAEQIINCFNVEELGSNNNVTLNSAQLDWVNNTSNRDLVPLNSFLQSNNCSNEAQVLGAEAIDLLSLPELDQNLDIDTYETRILRMTTYLKQFGNPEDEFFADYVESIIPDFINMTVGDVYDIYKLTEEQTDNLIFKYFEAVVTPFAELAVAYIAFAVTEATLGGALPLLRRIPLAMVIQGNRLQKILKQVGLLGVQGQAGNHIRIVTTNGSAYTKALELFTSLTRNAQSITISANGTRVALFNGGNKIVFRIQSSSGFPATMELTFSEIWAQTRIIKFL